MDPQYESVVLETFYSFYEQGLVYKGLKSVYWCIHDKTALAEAEVEYEMDEQSQRLGALSADQRCSED